MLRATLRVETEPSAIVHVEDGTVELPIRAEQVRIIHDGGAPEYTGEYTVTPRVYEQSLPTADRTLLNDVVVRQIPVFRTRNPAGGDTINIGG